MTTPVQHYTASDASHALTQGILPWLHDHTQSWQGESFAVIVPAVHTSHWIKREAGAHLGVDFLTPGRIRARLGKHPDIAFQESPRLDTPEFAFFQERSRDQRATVYRDASSIFEAYQKLDTTGYFLRDHDTTDPFFKYIRELDSLVKKSGFQLAEASDRELLGAVMNQPELFLWDSVLIYGFGPNDMHLYSVLSAVLLLTRRVRFIHWEVFDPKFGGLWMNTWEALLGPAELLSSEVIDTSPTALASELLLDSGVFVPPDQFSPVSIFQGSNAEAVANGIITQISDALEMNASARIGLLYQSVTPFLSILLSRLEASGIELCMRVGKKTASDTLPLSFGAWVRFQSEGTLDGFIRFLRALHNEGALDSKLMTATIRSLESAFADLQVADFQLLSEWIYQYGEDSHISGFIDHWRLLESEDSLEHYFEDAAMRFEDAALSAFLESAQSRADAFALDESEGVGRGRFFEWLRALFERATAGSLQNDERTFSPVQVVNVREAMRESWTHLIVLDGSQDHWDLSTPSNPWLSDSQLQEFNSKCLKPADSGGDDWVLRGRGIPVATQDEQRWQATCLRYLLFRQNLSAVFVWHVPRNPLDVRAERMLADWLEVWRRSLRLEFQTLGEERYAHIRSPEVCPSPLSQLKEAVEARNAVDSTFGPYDFCAPESRDLPRHLGIKDIEYALRDPAARWYLSVLSLRPRERYRDRLVRNLSEGLRLHRWMQWQAPQDPDAYGMEEPQFSAVPSRDDWEAQIRQRAQGALDFLRRVYGACGRNVPDWWIHQWNIQRTQISQVLDCFFLLAENNSASYAGFETVLPPGIRMGIEKKSPVQLSGRMDVLMTSASDGLVPGRSQGGERAFRILDFKSGNRAVPTPKQLAKGESLQLLLYARALWEMGSRDVAISIISRNVAKAKWLEIDFAGSTYDGILQVIQRMLYTRSYGYRPGTRDDFRFQETRPISYTEPAADILEARWNLTHPEWESILDK